LRQGRENAIILASSGVSWGIASAEIASAIVTPEVAPAIVTPEVAPAIVTPAVPAKATAIAVSAFIQAGTIPAVEVKAELDLFDHVERIGHASGLRERHRPGARGGQRAGYDNRQPGGGDQEFTHEFSLY
jgi:hypothetical protein